MDQAGPVIIGEVLQLDDQYGVGPYSLQLDLLVPLGEGHLLEQLGKLRNAFALLLEKVTLRNVGEVE